MRLPDAPGGSRGTPVNVTLFPDTVPRHTFELPDLNSAALPAVPITGHESGAAGAPGLAVPGTQRTTWAAGGSPIANRGSPPPPNRRLVTWVLKVRMTFAVGTTAPTGVGVPPEQLRTMSPSSSVSPSERMVGGTPALAMHCMAGVTWACAAARQARNSSAPPMQRARGVT